MPIRLCLEKKLPLMLSKEQVDKVCKEPLQLPGDTYFACGNSSATDKTNINTDGGRSVHILKKYNPFYPVANFCEIRVPILVQGQDHINDYTFFSKVLQMKLQYKRSFYSYKHWQKDEIHHRTPKVSMIELFQVLVAPQAKYGSHKHQFL